MNAMKQQNAQEMEDLRRENIALREQYQKIQEDNNLSSWKPMKSTRCGGNKLYRSLNRSIEWRISSILSLMSSWKHRYHSGGRC
ncbi:hypothetical protein D0Y65_014354 [Glycine soja]|uniref:Uncharacterized protein n=1 Tax=Glycine soja TaxID=3848 RepID=A0A445K7W2_GLYSO|nr:hypothetical protein JHK87_014873 [Glycine soja]RZC06877.1 hypothetical protein D0Y65_014354 [Glycine soja]RZC06878.1 hypothetical protein D0Y65_014354 [Glycine soja]